MTSPATLSLRGRLLVLAAAFLGWLGAGVQMGLGPLVARSALRDLLFSGAEHLSPAEDAVVGVWFARLTCAFLLGASAGGLLFGRLGDRVGRVRAMAASVACYSLFTAASWFAQSSFQLLILRFLTSLGIGGMWPCGVALASEAWPSASRPFVAGVMGAAANVGILLIALVGAHLGITPQTWRASVLAAASPVALAVFILAAVPESPRWLAAAPRGRTPEPLREIFRGPLLRRTLLGIVLGAIPLVGTWSSGKWMIPWAEAADGDAARTQALWASGAVLGAALGGYLADLLGRRTTYFVISVATVAINVGLYRFLQPLDPLFLPAAFLLGLVATTFFGWLPLYLPELFPTRVRATGAGVAFNFGRFASAGCVLAAGGLMTLFEGSYPRVGEVTAWVYGLGAVVILFAPDTRATSLPE
jgi:MFS family permease